MNPLILNGILKIGENLIDRFIPNETENAKAKLDLIKQTNDQDFQLLVKQIETNSNEAKHPSRMIAGWRPFIGWVCGVSLGLIYIPKAVVLTSVWTYQAITIISAWNGLGAPPTMPDYPDLGVSDLIGLLMSMLGIATLRTIDKIQGVSTMETTK